MAHRCSTSALSIAAAASLLALGGCATMTPPPQMTAETVPQGTEGMDPIAAAAFWGTRFDRDPDDPDTAAAFSQSLRAIGNNTEALNVTARAIRQNATHSGILLEHGKALIANERPFEALRPIENALVGGLASDAGAHSAYGVALDMAGDHAAARRAYAAALDIDPDRPGVLNNLALSYALAGRLDEAENTLRHAVGAEGGTALMRQNYALVLALAGKTSAAERLARSDLPPPVAASNVAYFKSLTGNAAYWGNLDDADVVLPDFGDDPAVVSRTPRATPVPEPTPSPTPGMIKRQPPAKTPARTPAPKRSAPEVRAEAAPAQNAAGIVVATEQPADTQTGAPKTLFFSNE